MVAGKDADTDLTVTVTRWRATQEGTPRKESGDKKVETRSEDQEGSRKYVPQGTLIQEELS